MIGVPEGGTGSDYEAGFGDGDENLLRAIQSENKFVWFQCVVKFFNLENEMAVPLFRLISCVFHRFALIDGETRDSGTAREMRGQFTQFRAGRGGNGSIRQELSKLSRHFTYAAASSFLSFSLQ
jgi:hypothetical protein